jgi:hypothetical protein
LQHNCVRSWTVGRCAACQTVRRGTSESTRKCYLRTVRTVWTIFSGLHRVGFRSGTRTGDPGDPGDGSVRPEPQPRPRGVLDGDAGDRSARRAHPNRLQPTPGDAHSTPFQAGSSPGSPAYPIRVCSRGEFRCGGREPGNSPVAWRWGVPVRAFGGDSNAHARHEGRAMGRATYPRRVGRMALTSCEIASASGA